MLPLPRPRGGAPWPAAGAREIAHVLELFTDDCSHGNALLRHITGCRRTRWASTRWRTPSPRGSTLRSCRPRFLLGTMLAWLPGALDTQLQRDAGISCSEYQVMSMLSMTPGRARRMSGVAALANGSLTRCPALSTGSTSADGSAARPTPPTAATPSLCSPTLAGTRSRPPRPGTSPSAPRRLRPAHQDPGPATARRRRPHRPGRPPVRHTSGPSRTSELVAERQRRRSWRCRGEQPDDAAP